MQDEIREILEKSRATNPEDFFIKVHYLLCRKFGWIPLEEFKRLPTPMVLDFLDCVMEETKEIKKGKKK
jgi:hypothetical protein